MKRFNNLKIVSTALLFSCCCMTTSCNFLDIVPEEQAGLPDATKDANATLGFLYSCYAGIKNPLEYGFAEGSSDEYALPILWTTIGQTYAYDLVTPQNYIDSRWEINYRFIGQIHLFIRELETARGVTEEQKNEWRAEAYFLLAYYHFEILRFFGPCPITDSYVDMSISKEEYHGRSHYDYVTNWIVQILDEKVIKPELLPATRSTNDVGRATSVIAKAIKAKALLYAASPLWNGKFPYPKWENKTETPGYGKELVSKTYSRDKWVAAEAACQEALDAALANGYKLYDDETMYEREKAPLAFIPGLANPDNAEGIAFRKKVMKMRYMMNTQSNEGNTELVWGLNKDGESMMWASLPNRILKMDNGSWAGGWSGVSPYFGTVECFYTKDGKLPAKDPNFAPANQWFQRAGVANRADVIKFHVNREPRFYAWIAFDQGDYGSKLANGSPLRMELKDSQKQGYNPGLFNRNHCVTGYLSQKYLRPDYMQSGNGSTNGKKISRPLIRMAELYLNLAECQAELGKTTETLESLNAVRTRAGVPALTEEEITAEMSLMEWTRNERFVELLFEGHRYFDVRRWAEGPKYLGAGKQFGLNAVSKLDPTFDEFNKRVKVDQPYRWSNRQYLSPVFYDEVYRNPQMVQAPGY